MTFAAPLFLLAALAAAIPVIIHMVNRQKAKDLPFPTLRFLKLSVQKTRRRKRIHDVLLMLLRAAVLLLIALGLARPALTNLSTLFGGGANSAVAIILDNSASMGIVDPEQPRFDTAAAAAGKIMDELADGDQVALLLTGGPGFPDLGRLDPTQEKVRQMLAQCRVSYEKADLAVKLHQARKLLAGSQAPNKQIFIITDNQELSWQGLKAPAEEEKTTGKAADPKAEGLDIPVILVDCNRAPKPNVAVQDVALSATVPVAGVPVKASVVLQNTAPVAQQRHAELYVDGVKEAASPALSIPAAGRTTHDFVFTFKRGGLHRGEVRLVGDDGSKLDDRRFFAMEVDQAIPVAVVKPQRHEIAYLEDTFYLDRALSPGDEQGWAIRTTSLVPADLLGEPLGNYKVIYCVNLPALQPEAAERLADYVAAGGNLVWIAGENVDPAAYNRMNEQAGGGLLPGPLLDVRTPAAEEGRDSWNVTLLDAAHPALRELVEPPALYESILVYKHVRLDAAAGGAHVLAGLAGGEPLLVERGVAEGKVLWLGTGVHTAWTNLPLRPIFMPLVVRLTFNLSGAEIARRQVLAGAPLVVPLDDEVRQVGVEVLPPGGETIRLKSEEIEGGKGQKFRYADTHEIGVYVLRLFEAVRPTQLAYSVNVDPDEALPGKLSREELTRRFGPTPVIFAEDPEDLSSTFKLLREGRSLWGLFLTAVLVFLVFEVLISNRLSPKQDETSPGRTPAAGGRTGTRRRVAASI